MTFIIYDGIKVDLEDLKTKMRYLKIPFTRISYYDGIIEIDGLFTKEEKGNLIYIINQINNKKN